MTPDDGAFLLRQSFRNGLPAIKLSDRRDYREIDVHVDDGIMVSLKGRPGSIIFGNSVVFCYSRHLPYMNRTISMAD